MSHHITILVTHQIDRSLSVNLQQNISLQLFISREVTLRPKDGVPVLLRSQAYQSEYEGENGEALGYENCVVLICKALLRRHCWNHRAKLRIAVPKRSEQLHFNLNLHSHLHRKSHLANWLRDAARFNRPVAGLETHEHGDNPCRGQFPKRAKSTVEKLTPSRVPEFVKAE